MKVKFTKASVKDKNLVTLNLTQFDNRLEYGLYVDREQVNKGQEIVVVINNVPTIFIVNRVKNGLAVTASTKAFPRGLRLPTVGRPVYANVQEVRPDVY